MNGPNGTQTSSNLTDIPSGTLCGKYSYNVTGGVVLSRVKAFLPIIEQENKRLQEKIKVEGAKSVQIDSDLADDDSRGVIKEVGSDVSLRDNTESVEASHESAGAIELEFAIGDFDDKVIAELECDK